MTAPSYRLHIRSCREGHDDEIVQTQHFYCDRFNQAWQLMLDVAQVNVVNWTGFVDGSWGMYSVTRKKTKKRQSESVVATFTIKEL